MRALARTPDKLLGVPWRDEVEVVQGDLGHRDSLRQAFDGVEVLYYLVHSMGTAANFADTEHAAVENVVATALETGVSRVVYLGGLHPAGADLSPHLTSRTLVGDTLIASGIETVVLQAGVVIGSGSASFEMVRHLTDRLPVMTTPKWVHNKIQPIAVSDVLHYLVEAATAVVPESRGWDIGGPDILEYGEMMQGYAQVAGLRRRRILVLPWLTPSIASWWVGLVTPIPSGLARPLVESLHCDAVADDKDIDTVIAPPPAGLTPYVKSVQLALDQAARGDFEPTWPAGKSEAAAAADPLPSDPDWAGQRIHTDAVSTDTPADADAVWSAMPALANRHWRIYTSDPQRRLLLLGYSGKLPGRAWLEVHVSDDSAGGSVVQHRATLRGGGLPGQLYAVTLWPLHRKLLHRKVSQQIANAPRHLSTSELGTSKS